MTDSKQGLPWLVLLLAFSGLGVAVTVPDKPAPAPASQATTEAPKKPESPAEPVPSFAECRARMLALVDAGYPPDVVVATVPDPLDSLYPRLFDLFTAALRRAAEAEEYSEDMSCLPWVPPDPKVVVPKEGPAHRREPGWLVFRRGDSGATAGGKPASSLSIFLVGESPPRGVQEAALLSALGLARELTRAFPEKRLKLLAPTFSSSTVSLGLTLKAWRARLPLDGSAPITLDIRSGTATASHLEDVIGRVLGSATGASVPLQMNFDSLAASDALLREALFRHFLPDQFDLTVERKASSLRSGGSSLQPEVAMLVESSLYGRGFQQALPGQGETKTLLPAVVVPFPMHISTLRAEYEKQGATKNKADDSGEVSGLSLATGADAPARDAPRVFDVAGTSRTQDLELRLLLSDIARQRVPLVGIVATNIRDTLFLAELLKKHAPDVRLFTFEGDLLLAHPSFASATRGMLVVSSQGLFESSPAPGGVETQLYFESDGSEGVYRALRDLLEPQHKARKIWISAVGRNGLYPLRTFGVEDGKLVTPPHVGIWEGAKVSWRDLKIPPPPRGWSLLVMLFTFLALLVFFLPEPYRLSTLVADRHSTLLAFLASLLVVVPALLAAGPAILARENRWPRLLLAASLVDLVLLAGLCFWLGAKLWRHHTRSSRLAAEHLPALWAWWERWGLLLLAVTGALAVPGLMFCNLAVVKLDEEAIGFLFQRTIRFNSGLSPALPLFLLVGVILAWLLQALSRQDSLRLLPAALTLPPAWRQALHPRFGGALAELSWALAPLLSPAAEAPFGPTGQIRRSPWQRLAVRLAIWFLALLAPLLYLSFYSSGGRFAPAPALQSLEHWAFSWEISVFFAAAMACSIEAGLALWRGWRSLRRLVNELAELDLGPPLPAPKPEAQPENKGNTPKLPSWAKEIEAATKSAMDAEERLLERRDAALTNLVDELARTPEEGVFAAADLNNLRQKLPRDPTSPGRTELASLWLAVAGWAAANQPSGESWPAAQQPLAAKAASFFAWQTAFLTSTISRRLISLMRLLTLGLIGILIAVSVYPFEPERVIAFYVGSMVAAAVLVSLAFVFQAEKDPLLSHIAGTEAGRINWHRSLLQKLGLYAVVPLLTLLTRQVPQLQQLLGGLLEPLAKVFS